MFADLFQAIILEHYRTPQNVGLLEDAVQVRNDHPSCGDKVTLSVKVKDGVVEDIQFLGEGCSISQASLSMMTELVKGKSIAEVRCLYERFRDMLQGREPDEDALGDMVALQGVSRFPARVPCATLGWETLFQALELEGAAEYDPNEPCG